MEIAYHLNYSLSSMCNASDDEAPSEEDTKEGKGYADELMTGVWYSELYKMFFKNTGDFYHNTVAAALHIDENTGYNRFSFIFVYTPIASNIGFLQSIIKNEESIS